MKAITSILNVGFSRFMLVFGRNSTTRFFSSRNLALPSSSLSEDEQLNTEDIISDDSIILRDKTCSEFEVRIQGRSPLRGHNQVSDDYWIKQMRILLKKNRPDVGYQKCYYMDLEQFILRLLDEIYKDSLDSAFTFHVFLRLECYLGSEHTVRTVCRMIHILVAGSMNHVAFDLILDLVRKKGQEEGSYSMLFRILYETHTEKKALDTICSILVDCHVKENKVDEALNLTYQVKQFNIYPSMGVHSSLLRALLRSDQLDLAWDLLEEMKIQGMCVNASIMSLFIRRYCVTGDLQSSWMLLTKMKNYGIRPDVISYTIVIDYLCKRFFLKEATCLLFKMIEQGISLDSVSVSSVIDGYCKGGKLVEAINILERFRLTPNVFIYNSFMTKLCTDGKMYEVSMFFHEMLELGLRPDCFSYTTIIGGFCKAGDMFKAFEYLGRMLKSGNEPSVATYTLFIDTFCKLGDMDMAEYLFQKMIDMGPLPDVVAYNCLMDGYGKKKELHKVFKLLNMMTASSYISPNIVTYNTLIHGLLKNGFVNEAKNIMDELPKRGFCPDVVTFTDVVDGFFKEDEFEKAVTLWSYMSEHVKPDVITCSALLNGYCKSRSMEKANILFLRMCDAGLRPDLILYNTLVHGFCSVGNTDEACNLVGVMIKDGIFPNSSTHRALIRGFEKKKVAKPFEYAALKLEEILLRHGFQVDIDEYLATILYHPLA